MAGDAVDLRKSEYSMEVDKGRELLRSDMLRSSPCFDYFKDPKREVVTSLISSFVPGLVTLNRKLLNQTRFSLEYHVAILSSPHRSDLHIPC